MCGKIVQNAHIVLPAETTPEFSGQFDEAESDALSTLSETFTKLSVDFLNDFGLLDNLDNLDNFDRAFSLWGPIAADFLAKWARFGVVFARSGRRLTVYDLRGHYADPKRWAQLKATLRPMLFALLALLDAGFYANRGRHKEPDIYEERAAVVEFDGGYPRPAAEALAYAFTCCPIRHRPLPAAAEATPEPVTAETEGMEYGEF